MERLYRFFGDDFMAPHGFCFFWLPEILVVHVLADALIALSYFSIPVMLWYFAKMRPDMPFKKLFFLFAAFITLCGLTHIFGIIVLWFPYYGIEGLIMLATGLVSAFTAYQVWKILPKALTLPSPTELEQINTQLQLSKEEIERLVQIRTRELENTNADLALARQKAEEANRAKTDFLANMSHEIRTPMNVIIGIARIMKQAEGLTGQQAEYLKTLSTSAESLMQLINDILDISKIESGMLEFEEKPFSVIKVVEEIGTLFQFQAMEKGLIFSKNIACDGLRQNFIGDANKLRQVLINLCSNAIKFTDEGVVSITVECRKIEETGRENVTITVKDTGIGIAADKLDKVFDKFVQADSSLTRKYGGTGLGLTISKFLIEGMGGTITVSSEAGVGTQFTVEIPMRVAEYGQ